MNLLKHFPLFAAAFCPRSVGGRHGFKIPRGFAIVALSVVLAGCEDVSDSVSSGLPLGVPTQVRIFPGDPRATFAAARGALNQLDFRFVSGGPAQGELHAISEVAPGDNPGSSHQYTLRAQFHGTLDGTGTEVSVQMTEIVEDDSEHHQGEGTEVGLRDTALYDSFFNLLQQQLAAAPHG
jgi:hypothetical protein